MMTRVHHSAHMIEIINAYKVLVGKPEMKGPLQKFEFRWT
jgi:hypothetical protein